jgi:hypothetical protein
MDHARQQDGSGVTEIRETVLTAAVLAMTLPSSGVSLFAQVPPRVAGYETYVVVAPGDDDAAVVPNRITDSYNPLAL